MLFFRLTISCVFFLFISQAISSDKVIYGEDNRKDVYAYDDNLFKELSRSTAAMISKRWFDQREDGFSFLFRAKSLKDTLNTCDSELFNLQPVAAGCTGFLVGEDLLVTAGHCMDAKDKCPDYVWAFDYKMKNENELSYLFPNSNIYECREVIELKLNLKTKEDYALIRLKRKVTDRKPLQFRRKGQVSTESDLTLVGHPTGLPMKITDGGKIRDNSAKAFFKTTLDAYGGNSGSPVFDSKTGIVEGILSSGESDWVYQGSEEDDEWTLEAGCYVSNRCKDDDCLGENVTRITEIEALKK